MDALALNLHHDLLTGFQRRRVYLGDGGAAQRLIVEAVKHFVQLLPISAFNDGNHLFIGHRLNVCAQARQRVTVDFGQEIRTHRQDLAQLDESWAKFFYDRAQLFGRYSFGDLIAPQHLDHFAQALPVLQSLAMPV